MSDVPRKILAVQKDPAPGRDTEYRFMIEWQNKTYSFQTGATEGERIQRTVARVLLEEMNRGITRGTVKPERKPHA